MSTGVTITFDLNALREALWTLESGVFENQKSRSKFLSVYRVFEV